MGLIYCTYCIFLYNSFRIHSKTGGFSFLWRQIQIFPSLNWNMLIFLPRRRFVTGDVLLRRHLVRRRFVTETFGKETFFLGDILCGDVLYVRRIFGISIKFQIFLYPYRSIQRNKMLNPIFSVFFLFGPQELRLGRLEKNRNRKAAFLFWS
jgi:hypothetical protein